MLLAAIASPLTRVFDVLERQRTDLACSVGMIVLQTAALVVGGRTGDVFFTLLLLGIAGVVARMLPRLQRRDEYVADVRRMNKVINESDVWPLEDPAPTRRRIPDVVPATA